MNQRIIISVKGSVATISLNRPDKRNALDALMVEELHAELLRCIADNDVRVILLTGTGPAFCAGADLSYLQEISRNEILENQRDSQSLMHLLRDIAASPKPTVASVRGPALAGGCGLATVCDITVA